jgi:hypothetical protein
MIWHELSQSASLLDWVHDYAYMFVHVDTTFQFLTAVGQYVSTSGELGRSKLVQNRITLGLIQSIAFDQSYHSRPAAQHRLSE